jgi:membrane protein YdbS with pleckstrin-like domain
MTTGEGGSPDIKAEFAKRLLIQRLSIIPMVVVIVLFAVLGDDKTIPTMQLAALIAFTVVALAVAFYAIFRYWRCPNCNKHLPVNNTLFAVKKCDKCGAELS